MHVVIHRGGVVWPDRPGVRPDRPAGLRQPCLTSIYTCQELGGFQTAGYIGPLKIYAADIQARGPNRILLIA